MQQVVTPKIVARLSGLVSFTDGSKQQFAVHLDHRGNISYNGSKWSALTGDDESETINTIQQAHSQPAAWLQAMFTLVGTTGPTITYNAAAPPILKTIKSLVAELSGRVTFTPTTPPGKSWEDFIFQYDSNRADVGTFGAMIPRGNIDATIGDGGTGAWNKAATNFATQLNAMFTGLGLHTP